MKVKLMSMEGKTIEMEAEVAALSRFVQTLMSDEQEDVDEVLGIPLPNVKASTLAKVVKFCQHYKDDPMNDMQMPIWSVLV
ncbi:unnamed protein product [Peronospora farinosa]|uniref:SKP1 component POZ domain-containing protein n=1 Tax=Peronospora farinosa TaxID=134698 RepID=A0ABN8BVH6_9STRA|nr:unnamed protein product [Peronospora farinosa]